MYIQETAHFSAKELECKCGRCDYPGMDAAFMEKIERVRAALGYPMRVNSAYRCPDHNITVSNTGPMGPHTTGRAIDVAVAGYQAFQVVEACVTLGLTGIGCKQHGAWNGRFIHIDDLEGPTRPWIWSYP